MNGAGDPILASFIVASEKKQGHPIIVCCPGLTIQKRHSEEFMVRNTISNFRLENPSMRIDGDIIEYTSDHIAEFQFDFEFSALTTCKRRAGEPCAELPYPCRWPRNDVRNANRRKGWMFDRFRAGV